MMTIHFTSGEKIEVGDDAVKLIADRLLSPRGATNWQTFTDEKTGRVLLMFDMSKVTHITDDTP